MENVVPSFPSVTLSGIVERSMLIYHSRFDAPAMYTRDITKLEQYIGAWLGQEPTQFADVCDQEGFLDGDKC